MGRRHPGGRITVGVRRVGRTDGAIVRRIVGRGVRRVGRTDGAIVRRIVGRTDGMIGALRRVPDRTGIRELAGAVAGNRRRSRGPNGEREAGDMRKAHLRRTHASSMPNVSGESLGATLCHGAPGLTLAPGLSSLKAERQGRAKGEARASGSAPTPLHASAKKTRISDAANGAPLSRRVAATRPAARSQCQAPAWHEDARGRGWGPTSFF